MNEKENKTGYFNFKCDDTTNNKRAYLKYNTKETENMAIEELEKRFSSSRLIHPLRAN